MSVKVPVQRDMNAENFAEYLKKPALLYQLSYEELKTLALQYPYSQNIQYLLLIKSKLDNHKDYDKNLARAAASMTDRTFLYRKIKEFALAAVEEGELISNEEILELRELSALEEDLLEKIPVNLSVADPPKHVENSLDLELPVPGDPHEEEDEDDFDIHFPTPEMGEAVGDGDPEPQEQEVATGFRIGKQDILTISAFAAVMETTWEKPSPPTPETIEAPAVPVVVPIADWTDALETVEGISEILEFVLPRYFAHIPPPAPLPKAAFRSWKRQLVHRPIIPPSVNISDEPVEQQPVTLKDTVKATEKKKRKKKTKVREIAAASLEERKTVASETLAKLLENQGQYQKAIKMYEQLILSIPEKSGYFAEQIEKLKNL